MFGIAVAGFCLMVVGFCANYLLPWPAYVNVNWSWRVRWLVGLWCWGACVFCCAVGFLLCYVISWFVDLIVLWCLSWGY